MFTQQAYTWLTALRAISAVSLIVLICALLAEPYNPLTLTTAVAVCTLTWMLTAPWVAILYVAGIKLNLDWLLARKWTRRTPPSLARLSRAMGAPLPRRTKLVAIDKANAATDGTTLFITRGFEPYLGTSVGEAVLAHELAHMKSGHGLKHSLLIGAVLFSSWQFGAQFWAFHDVIGVAMGGFAFLTLGAFLFPLASRRMEYDADALACRVVEPAVMISALEILVPAERWVLESDSHPSVKARIQRLQAN